MDDIRVDDDPRRQSAKKLKNKVVEKKQRGFGGFLVDWFIKSLLMSIVLAIDFTLFVNSGNYKIFTDYGDINIEAMFIYAGIAAISFIVVLLFMIIIPLEDVLLSAVFAATGIAIINQFATFDKQSGLIVLVGEWLSNDVNALLYQYFYWIAGAGVFLITFILLKLLKRSGAFYLTLLLGGLCGWLVSESYLNPNKVLFRQVVSNASKAKSNEGKNLVFLAFNNLTSINNLKNISSDNKLPIADKTWQNALAFLTRNDFVIYPNAVVDNSAKPFQNLYNLYNLNDTDAHGDSFISQYAYFDFNLLQPEKSYLDKSSLFNALKDQGYEINAYQINRINICRLGNGNMVTSCYEKVNYPIVLPADKVSITDRIIILASQWIVSTGLVKDINPVLNVIRYAYNGIKAYDFKVDRLDVINSFNVFNMIINDMKYKEGNQAYFAIIDLPSDTFVYDEYCVLKPVKNWVAASGKSLASQKQQAYLEQTACLYGQLDKFMRQLKKNEVDDNTSVVLVGLNNPSFIGNIADKSFYRKIQALQQVGLAIRPLKSNGYKFDYRFCNAGELLNMHFLNKRACKEFNTIKTTEKNLDDIKKSIKADMFSEANIISANSFFSKWFDTWSETNNYDFEKSANEKKELKADSQINETVDEVIAEELITAKENDSSDIVPVIIEENNITDNQYEQVESSELQENAAEVIPSTLFDNGVNVENTAYNDKTKKADNVTEEQTVEDKTIKIEVKEDQTVKVPTPAIIEKPIQKAAPKPTLPENPKLGYDLKQTIEDAKSKAQQNIEQANKKAAEEAEKAQQKVIEKRAEPVRAATNKQISKQDEAIKSILVAPETNGKKLSPEELKAQYHEMLRQAKIMSGNTISIEIVE